MENGYSIEMRHVTKCFGAFKALDDMRLQVRKGEIHALLGENGAGKTTLMNVLYGLTAPDAGEILVNGKVTRIRSSANAIKQGIGMVHQHFMLVENFTVTENIMLGSEITNKLGFLNKSKAREAVKELSQRFALSVDPDAQIKDISVGMQQRVEILKALYRGADILILDEPTAVLTPQEIDELAEIMRLLAASGKSIIIITHKLKEIMKTADVCTVISRGRYIDTVNVNETNEQQLAELMVGHAVKLVVDKTPAQPAKTVFEIKDLHVKDARGTEKVKGLNLTVRSGEIVGIAGIDGNGQKELVDAITNHVHTLQGEILINGTHIENTTPRFTMDNGVSTIHEDRKKRGLVPMFSVSENVVLDSFASKAFSRGGILNKKRITAFAKQLISRFDIRPAGCEASPAGSLSGGNQQKVIIAREVTNDPELLIAVQPTRGLDVGAIEYVHKSLIEQRDKGKAVLLISLELDEVMNVADTIDVIYDGKIVKSIKQGTATENEIGLWMTGGENSEA